MRDFLLLAPGLLNKDLGFFYLFLKKLIMTVKELYDYITSQMSPEEALMKLLEGTQIQYERLKFEEGKAVHPIHLAAMVAMDLGWQIGIEKETETVEGIVMGTEEYMKRIFPQKEEKS